MKIKDLVMLLEKGESKDVDYIDTEVTIIKPPQDGESGKGEGEESNGNVVTLPPEDQQSGGGKPPKSDDKEKEKSDSQGDGEDGEEDDEENDGDGGGGSGNDEQKIKPGMKVRHNVTGEEGIVISVDETTGEIEVSYDKQGLQKIQLFPQKTYPEKNLYKLKNNQ